MSFWVMESVMRDQTGKQIWLHHILKLNNLTAFIDNNNYQQTGQNDEIMRYWKIKR